MIGLARVKRLGNIEFYEGTDAATQQKYAGGFVWQRNVETLYPDQGLRIPYHRFLDKPDVLEKITVIPENTRCFKYGYLPDFTILWRGDRYFWEHLGLLVRDEYRKKWAIKKARYEKHFPGQLVTTEESGNLSVDAKNLIEKSFS